MWTPWSATRALINLLSPSRMAQSATMTTFLVYSYPLRAMQFQYVGTNSSWISQRSHPASDGWRQCVLGPDEGSHKHRSYCKIKWWPTVQTKGNLPHQCAERWCPRCPSRVHIYRVLAGTLCVLSYIRECVRRPFCCSADVRPHLWHSSISSLLCSRWKQCVNLPLQHLSHKTDA